MTDTTTEAGVFEMSDADYFALDALSHSDCKLLLDSPAKFEYLRRNPSDAKPPTDDMRFGSAVHAILLGGPTVQKVDADSWRTNAAKEMRAEAEAGGDIALLTDDYKRAFACANAAYEHTLAAKLLAAADETEVVAIWDDGDIQRRAKLDARSGRFGVDVKTTYNAGTDDFGRSAAKYGYASQAAFYMDALTACWGIDNPAFLFVVIEKTPPFLVNVIEIDPYDLELGRRNNRRALDLYRQCRDTDTYPAYGDGINVCEMPKWWQYEMEMT